jgi:hypothetical protein
MRLTCTGFLALAMLSTSLPASAVLPATKEQMVCAYKQLVRAKVMSARGLFCEETPERTCGKSGARIEVTVEVMSVVAIQSTVRPTNPSLFEVETGKLYTSLLMPQFLPAPDIYMDQFHAIPGIDRISRIAGREFIFGLTAAPYVSSMWPLDKEDWLRTTVSKGCS